MFKWSYRRLREKIEQGEQSGDFLKFVQSCFAEVGRDYTGEFGEHTAQQWQTGETGQSLSTIQPADTTMTDRGPAVTPVTNAQPADIPVTNRGPPVTLVTDEQSANTPVTNTQPLDTPLTPVENLLILNIDVERLCFSQATRVQKSIKEW